MKKEEIISQKKLNCLIVYNYKIIKKILYIFILSIIIIIIVNDNKIKNLNIFSIKKDRILVYTCCDELYSHYIPIFCNTILRADKLKLIDIEIGVNLDKLSDNEEKALDYIRKKYFYSKIHIKYNFFIKNTTGTFFNNFKVFTNSIRFISQPTIKNKYVYITDIDMIILVDNFYLHLLDDMNRRNNKYSNIVRKNSHRLSGLHFTEYEAYYPIPKQKKYNICDENLLFNIVKSKLIKIDYKTEYRPNFGIHASPNRPNVGFGKIVGWFAELHKFSWLNYINSKDFKYIQRITDLIE